jgi:hypothetical protein
MTTTSNTRRLMKTRTKEKPRPPVADVDLHRDRRGQFAKAKTAPEESAAGLFNELIDFPFEYMGQRKPIWKLSAEEKKWLHKAVGAVADEAGMDKLKDKPGPFLAVILLVIVGPRLAIEVMEYYENRRKRIQGREAFKPANIRPAEPDHPAAGEEGSRQDVVDKHDLFASPPAPAPDNI